MQGIKKILCAATRGNIETQRPINLVYGSASESRVALEGA